MERERHLPRDKRQSWVFGTEIVSEMAGISRGSVGSGVGVGGAGAVGSGVKRGEAMTSDKQRWIEEMMSRARTTWEEHGPSLPPPGDGEDEAGEEGANLVSAASS